MLVLSYHEGGGRILQIHAEHGRLFVRVSRRLDLLSSDGTVPADARLMIQWLLSKPIGNTYFSSASRSFDIREDCYQDKGSDTASTLRIQTPAASDVPRA